MFSLVCYQHMKSTLADRSTNVISLLFPFLLIMAQMRSRRIADEEWESHKQEIVSLYTRERKELKGRNGLIAFMKERHAFVAR